MNYQLDYINNLGIDIDVSRLEQLERFLDLVWEKKDSLNLTSAKDRQEIWDRHILDALIVAPLIGNKAVTISDCGAGAGYIGISLKIALPQTKVFLIESLERRCSFMEWVIFKLGLKDIYVINARVGEGIAKDKFDFVVQRAMGKIDDVLPLCAGLLEKDGSFIAYQAQDSYCKNVTLAKCNMVRNLTKPYVLPGETKERKLVVFKWI